MQTDARVRVPVVLAVAGGVAIVVGIHQGLVHVAPGYEGTIVSGWGGKLNHEERLLAAVGAVGIAGSIAARRWRRLCVVPIAAGGVVLFYALRAIGHWVWRTPLYVETSIDDGDPTVFVLGAEPFLLVIGGALLIAAGVLGWRRHSTESDGRCGSRPSSVTR
jgi:hypothetical protein